MSKHIDSINDNDEVNKTRVETTAKFDETIETEKLKSKFEDSIGKLQSNLKNTESFNDYTETSSLSDRKLKSAEDKVKISNGNSDILDWEGETGNSKRKPKEADSELAKELSEYGVDGIEYKDGDIDFSPVSKYDVEFENVDELYKSIGEDIAVEDLMTDDAIKSRSDLNDLIRNKWQTMVKQQIVDKMSDDSEFAADLQKKTGIDVSCAQSVNGLSNQLKRNGLTMHETPDCKKIQFVPTKIHDAFKHSGGTAEMLERMFDGDTHGRISANN